MLTYFGLHHIKNDFVTSRDMTSLYFLKFKVERQRLRLRLRYFDYCADTNSNAVCERASKNRLDLFTGSWQSLSNS